MSSEGRTLDQLTKSELQILQVNTLVKQKKMFEIVMEVVALYSGGGVKFVRSAIATGLILVD
jgi:hypothetical protein